MKKFFIILLLSAALSGTPAGAAEKNNSEIPDFSIGISGSYGSFTLKATDNMGVKTEPGLYAGGGITIEKRIHDNFGFGTGIGYRYFYTDFSMEEDGGKFDVRWRFQSINIPLLMIVSINGGFLSLNLEGGAVYSYVHDSIMKSNTTTPEGKNEDNALKFTDSNQIGLTAGVIFKLKITRFTDCFLGTMIEYYPTNLLEVRDDSNDKLNMQNYSFTAGYMFRTNLFPGTSKND